MESVVMDLPDALRLFGGALLAFGAAGAIGLVAWTLAHRNRDASPRRAPPPAPTAVVDAPGGAEASDLTSAADRLAASGSKICPRCAEEVKAAALVCRFCGWQFGPSPAGTEGVSAGARAMQRGPAVRLVALAVIAVIVVGAVAASGALGAKHTLTGYLTVSPSDGSEELGWLTSITTSSGSVQLGGSCTTRGADSDIVEGTDVSVRDDADKVVGSGALAAGTLDFTTHVVCVFRFSVTGIPDATFYTVEIGSRGKLTFSKDDLDAKHWSIVMTANSGAGG